MVGAEATRVVLRVRPFNARESGTARCLECVSDTAVGFAGGGGGDAPASFNFDRVWGEGSSQEAVFQELKGTVQSVLHGFNGCILAYGQTGSGKTHTLLGDIHNPQQRGIVPRVVAELAQGIAAYTEPCRFKVTLSVVEIYCERIKDLLCPENDNLQVVADRSRGGVVVGDATEVPVGNEAECVRLMQMGIANRAQAATAMNAESSRSHCVVYLVVERAFPDGRNEFGKLCLVDLAGSERQDKTGTQGQAATEGNLINKSLSVLGNVVNALTDGRSKSHIPYRDSKLTRVLQDSLGGSAQTCLIICCSPSLFNAAETLSTLRFGARAKGIQNSVQANAVRHDPEQLAGLLAAAQKEIAGLKQHIAVLEGKAGSSSGKPPSAPGATPRWPGWLLVLCLQLAGLLAYFAAEDALL